MAHSRRNIIILGCTLLAGCTTSAPHRQQITTESTTGTTETGGSSGVSDPVNPNKTLKFGESHVDTGLEITVETPTVQTNFDHEGKSYRMNDGSALALAPVTFHNTKSEGLLPIDGPIFTLLVDGVETLETHSVKHPEFDPTIRVRQLDDVPTTQRWTAEGDTVEPGEQLSGTAVFRTHATLDSSSLRIVYVSDRIDDDRFGNETVLWKV